MANSSKDYAYYIEGGKLGLVEKDVSFDNDVESKEFGPGVSRQLFKSPQSTVADALEFKYAYAPTYTIDETDDKNTALDTYLSLDGLLKVVDSASDNYSASPESLSDGSFIVLRKAGRWNGLHKVKDAGIGYITLYTKFSGSASVEVAFEEAPELYYNVSALEDESFELDLPNYLQKALVYYIKSKFAEDAGDFNLREAFRNEFKRILERDESNKIRGVRMVSTGSHAIR